MHFAIYGRKSVYSDKSDSISNQIRMCREYIGFKFPGQADSIVEYTDEGLTGANTDRPQLKAMLADAADGLIDALVVYQLDRLSRDVRDFANIYAALEEKHVLFVSIKETIDTATPIGRAMMYVTMVFAQMERETIAARVTDNMLGLAKKGFWTSGTPPYGYVSQRVEVNGKKHVVLSPDPEASTWINWIYDTFLENNYSLRSMETAFRRQGVKTQNGAYFGSAQIYKILTSPYCVEATEDVYDYFAGLGCKIDPDSPKEKWDGQRGVMVYGRNFTRNKRHRVRPKEEWTVCIGLHKPFVSAEKWLSVQNKFEGHTFDKKKKYDVPLLKGALRCAKCGCLMTVSRQKTKKGISSAYHCVTRSRKGPDYCNMRAISCGKLDEKMLEVFRRIEADPSSIMHYVLEQGEEPDREWRNVEVEIASYEAKIARLADLLSEVEDSSAAKHIVAKIEELDANVDALRREEEMQRVQRRRVLSKRQSAEQKVKEIQRLLRNLDGFTADEKNEIVRGVVRELTWDGETLFIRL